MHFTKIENYIFLKKYKDNFCYSISSARYDPLVNYENRQLNLR